MLIEQHRQKSTRVINMAQVVTAEREHGEKGTWRILTAQGDELHVDDISWSLALSITPASTFPAAPGTSLIWCSEDDGEWLVGRQAVVGWMIDQSGNLLPLSLDAQATENSYYVEHPGGRIEAGRSLDTWDNIDEFVADQRKRSGMSD